jgi:cytochrome c biogenesis protein CcdA
VTRSTGILAFFLFSLFLLQADIDIEPREIDFGVLAAGSVKSSALTIRNRGDEALLLEFHSSLPNLEIIPATAELAPSQTLTVSLRLDGVPPGPLNAPLVISGGSAGDTLLWMRGQGEERAVEPEIPASSGADLYFSADCRECHALIDRLQAFYGDELRLHDIDRPGELGGLFARLEKEDISIEGFPVLFAGGSAVDGFGRIREYLDTGDAGRDLKGYSFRSLAPLPLIGAGLLDGINPCAFATLIFFISVLTLSGRSRGALLAIGLSYTLGVFLCYFAVGAGFLSLGRLIPARGMLAGVLELLLMIFLAVMAALSFRDFLLARQGRLNELTLRLSPAAHRRVHGLIRGVKGSPAIGAAAFLLGAGISLLELGCTGQVYLPAIGYILKVEGRAAGFGYLLIYNLAFVMPLVLILGIALWGGGSERLGLWLRRHLAAVRLLFSILFLLFLALMLFA